MTVLVGAAPYTDAPGGSYQGQPYQGQPVYQPQPGHYSPPTPSAPQYTAYAPPQPHNAYYAPTGDAGAGKSVY